MTPDRRVVLYFRTPVAHETEQRQETVLARAKALRDRGVIDDLTVTHWNRTAGVTDVEPALPSIVEMEHWATEHDGTLEPAFDRHDRNNWYTGVQDSVVTLPVICLTVFEGDELVGVYPHVGPSGHQTVGDCLAQLESESKPFT